MTKFRSLALNAEGNSASLSLDSLATDGSITLAPHAQANCAIAIRLAKAGLAVIPARVTFNEVTGRWDKRPMIEGWQSQATTDLPQIEEWWDRCPEALPGIDLTRAALLVIDADRHGGPDGVAAFEQLAEGHGGLPLGPVTLTAGGGQHFYFRQPDGDKLGCSPGSLPAGIDVRGRGGWIVAPGAIRGDGSRWQPAPDAPALEMAFAYGGIPVVPGWLSALVCRRGNKDHPEDIRPNRLALREFSTTSDRERAFAKKALEECAAELASTQIGGRNQKLNAVAYHMGRMVARAWIDRPDVADRLWEACEKNGLINNDGADAVQATLASGLEAGTQDPHPDLAERPLRPANDNVARSRIAPASDDDVFPGVWHGEENFVAPNWLIRDLLPENCVTLLSGESGAAKTFLAIHAAISIALGERFFGKRTRRGGTLFLAAEAGFLVGERLEAARIGVALPAIQSRDTIELRLEPLKSEALQGQISRSDFDVTKLPIHIITQVPNLLDASNEARLKRTIKKVNAEMRQRFGVPLVLVIVDTMLSAFNVSNWNDAAEATKATRVLARIADAGVAVMALAHHGKETNRGTAGSFALTAEPDSIISAFCEKEHDEVTRRWIVLSKSRRGDIGWSCDFALTPQVVGTDEDGEDVIPAYVTPLVSSAAGSLKIKTAPTPSPRLRRFMEVFEKAEMAAGQDQQLYGNGQSCLVVPREAVKVEFDRSYTTDATNRAEAVRKAFERSVEDGLEAGFVREGHWDGTGWLWRATNEATLH